MRPHCAPGHRAIALLLTLLAAGAAPSTARAQDGTFAPPPPGSGRVEVGVDAGGALTSSWFRGGGVERAPGLGPAFGAHATYWIVPTFGVRASAKYFAGSMRAQPLPLPPSLGFNADSPRVRVHGLSLGGEVVVRPFAGRRAPAAVQGLYAYAGASRLATGFSGVGEAPRPDSIVVCDSCVVFALVGADSVGERCAVPYLLDAICLVQDAVRLQYGAGVGTELRTPVRGLSLYADVSVQRYRSPAERVPVAAGHIGVRPSVAIVPGKAATAIAGANPHQAVTGRLTLGVKYSPGAPERFAPPPPPPPPPNPPPAYGATVSVRTPAGPAEVYLVPVTTLARQPRVLCALRPNGMNPYFKGRAAPGRDLEVNGTAQPYVLVVRSGTREQQIRVTLTDGATMVRVADLREASVPACLR